MSKKMFNPQITNGMVNKVVSDVHGNTTAIWKSLCMLRGIENCTVNKFSLSLKAKKTTKEIKRLQKFVDKGPLNSFVTQSFIFPKATQDSTRNVPQIQLKLQKQCLFKDVTITKLRSKVQISSLNIRKQKTVLKRKEHTIQKIRADIKLLTRGKKVTNANVSTQCAFKSETEKLLKKNLTLCHQQLNIVEDENVQMKENGQEEKEQKVPHFRETTKGRPFHTKIRECYYAFRSCNVACQHIGKLIKAALSIVDVDVSEDDLPSPTLAKSFTYEMGLVCNNQLQEELNSSQNITMHRDATTKKGRHYYGVEFHTGEKTVTAGVKEVADGKAETYVHATSEILHTLQMPNLITKVSNYMTDRSATETKVNRLLCQQNDTDIMDFKCSVHPLLQFSEVCEKLVKVMEKDFDVPNFHGFCGNSEAITICTLKLVSKLFFKDGSGDPLLASLYMKNKNIPIPIINFRGNRFNVMFHNAAGTHFLAPYILEYLETSKATLNQSQHFLVKALKNQHIMAICRALGVISKIVTQPYWKIAADSNMSALDMSPVYAKLVALLKASSENPSELLCNNLRLLPGPAPKITLEVQGLFASTDKCVESILAKFASAMKTKADHLFKDFLGDGKFANTSTQENTTCSSNNITVERLMAKVDSAIKRAPNINTHNLQHTIMYNNNNTAQWLMDKDASQTEHIIRQAQHDKKTYMAQTAHHKTQLHQRHLAVIEERRSIISKRKEREEEQKSAVIANIEDIGLWENEQEIHMHLMDMKTKKDKIHAIKTQFSICKEIFTIHTKDKALLAYSSKGKTFTLDTLVQNLTQLINIYHTPHHNTSDTAQYVGQHIIHTWTDGGQDTQWNGKVISYDKGIFKVQYWPIEELDHTGDDDSLFLITKDEFLSDVKDGCLKITSDEGTNSTNSN